MTTSEGSVTSPRFEDLAPGAEVPVAPLVLEPQRVTAAHVALGGMETELTDFVPVGVATAFVVTHLTNLGLGPVSPSGMTPASWTARDPVPLGATTRLRVRVTHRRLAESGHTGLVGLAIEVRDTAGTVLLEGAYDTALTTRSAEGALADEAASPSFAGPGWVSRLVARLSDSSAFSEATSAFDGSLSVNFGVAVAALRIYRGRVIDSGRSVANNPTFEVGASPLTWVEFAARPRNEFVAFAMRDEFTVRGSTYEYLRMAAAVLTVMDEVRSLLGAPPTGTSA